MTGRHIAATPLLLVVAACGTPTGSASAIREAGPDAGPGADAPAERQWPVPPRLQDWTCPDGWQVDVVGAGEPWEVSICEPPARVECEGATMQGVGEASCRRVGTECPAAVDGFPDEAVVRALAPGFGGELVYVQRGAGNGGDGSRAAPLGSLSELSTRAVSSGSVVVLAAGIHDGGYAMGTRLALVGACAEGTVVRSPHPQLAALALARDGGGRLTNVTLTGLGPGLVVRDVARPVEVTGVLIEDVGSYGVVFAEGSAGGTISDSVIRRVARGSTSTFAVGVQVFGGVDCAIERTVIEQVQDTAVAVIGTGSEATSTVIAEVVLHQSGPYSAGVGTGVLARGSAAVVVRRSLISESREVGLVAGDNGVSIDLTDVVVRDGAAPERLAGELTGHGIEVGPGAVVTGRRVAILHNRYIGLFALVPAEGPPAQVGLEDLVVRGTVPRADGAFGWGIVAFGPSEVVITRAAVSGNAELGVVARHATSGIAPTLTLTDSVIAGTLPGGTKEGGHGIELLGGSDVSLVRTLVSGNSTFGVAAVGWGGAPETRLSMEDVAVVATHAAPCGSIAEGEPGSCVIGRQDFAAGIGVYVMSGARTSLDGFELSGSALAGLAVATDGFVSARHGRITANPIGVNLLAPGVSDDQFEDVVISGNDVDVARQELPLPDAKGSVEGL